MADFDRQCWKNRHRHQMQRALRGLGGDGVDFVIVGYMVAVMVVRRGDRAADAM